MDILQAKELVSQSSGAVINPWYQTFKINKDLEGTHEFFILSKEDVTKCTSVAQTSTKWRAQKKTTQVFEPLEVQRTVKLWKHSQGNFVFPRLAKQKFFWSIFMWNSSFCFSAKNKEPDKVFQHMMNYG